MRAGVVYGAIGLTAALACSKASLDGNDAGVRQDASAPTDVPPAMDSISRVDASAPVDVGLSTDTSPPEVGLDGPTDVPAPPIGRRSFVVTSTLTPQPGGSGFVPLPATHTFTMVLDADSGTAIVGSTDGNGAGAFQPSAAGGTIGTIGSFRFGGSSMGYQAIQLAIDAAGKLSGTGSRRRDGTDAP